MHSICFFLISATCTFGFASSGGIPVACQQQAEDGPNGGEIQDPNNIDEGFEKEELSRIVSESESSPVTRKKREPQVTVRNGITTVTASDRDRNFKITEDRKNGIVVEIVRNYGPRDLERLKQNHPELVDYVDLFPKQSGSHQIELNLSIKSTYKARTPEQLKAKSKEAFEVYRQQIKKTGRRR